MEVIKALYRLNYAENGIYNYLVDIALAALGTSVLMLCGHIVVDYFIN